MDEQPILVERYEGYQVITLNRPNKHDLRREASQTPDYAEGCAFMGKRALRFSGK